ncbi:MAG TPA: calcium-binding protein [Rhizomicrobium sp.]|jgi:Ca2+-binding RTX toxin-like protein|nr:calcium-binding protein [Rhizomicrobium sp.]
MATYNGTGGDDVYTGTSDPDTINGNGGNDTLSGGAGDDIINGGTGNDIISGGDNNDTITGGPGDTIHGDAGDDTILYATDDLAVPSTTIYGDLGNDKLTLDFSAASDALSSYNYGDGSGYISGLVSYSGIESLTILGGSASDNIMGGVGDDKLNGNGGNDRLNGGAGVNTISGGAGFDIGLIDLSASATARNVTFDPTVTLNLAGNKLSGIEGLGLKTGSGNDTIDLTAETLGSEIYTNAGADKVTGGVNGFDYIDTGAGNDKIWAQRGDTVHAQDNDDQIFISDGQVSGAAANIYGEAGIDTLTIDLSTVADSIGSYNYQDGSGYMAGISYSGIEKLIIMGGTASDTLYGGSGDDTISGGAGNDKLYGQAGENILDGGSGNDIGYIDVTASTSDKVVTFVSGAAITIFHNNLSNIEGLGLKTGSGNDTIDVSGETIASEIYTNDGNDTVTGGVGADYIDVGNGNDTVNFGRGDTVHGGAGTDKFFAVLTSTTGAAANIYGEADSDTLTIDFSAAPDAITSSYNYGDGSGYIAGISYSGIEKVVFTGTAASDLIYGGLGDDVLNGGKGNDTLDAQKGHNNIDGGAGKDIGLIDLSDTSAGLTVTFANNAANSIGGNTLNHLEGLGFKGGTGNDKIDVSNETIGSKIYGGDGNDTLTGGIGADYLDGGNQNDIVKGSFGDTVHGGDGDDDLRFTATSATGGASFYGDTGTDKLTLDFSSVATAINSYNYNDGSGYAGSVSYSSIETIIFTGGSGADTMYGGFGNDTLNGGAGADTLLGGGGKDIMDGGADNDTFRWNTIAESTTATPGRDTINNWASGDRFDMRGLESSTGHTFSFIGTGAFTGVAGQIHQTASGSDTVISIDTDGVGGADFAFLVSGTHTFNSGDFIFV